MKHAAIVLTGLAALWASPATAAPECWHFDFRAADFLPANPPQPVVTGSFALMIDWTIGTTGPTLPNPLDVDVTIAGHSYAPGEIKWSYSAADDRLVLGPVDPLEDKEFFVTAGQDQLFLLVERPRSTASPAVFVYSVKGADGKWPTTKVAVSPHRCDTAHKLAKVVLMFRRPTYISCDIGTNVIRGLRRRSVTLRNRGPRVLPAGTTLSYSTPDGALETVRLERSLRPGAAVPGRPTQARSCAVEVVAPSIR